jgi:hypothetical protein
MDRNKNIRVFFYSAMFLIPFFAGQIIEAKEMSLLKESAFFIVAYLVFRTLASAKEGMNV